MANVYAAVTCGQLRVHEAASGSFVGGRLQPGVVLMKRITTLLAIVGFSICGVGQALADPPKQCRDPKTGHFTACPTTPPAARCRDKTTKKFAKCGLPNSEPVPTSTTTGATGATGGTGGKGTTTTTTTTKPPG